MTITTEPLRPTRGRRRAAATLTRREWLIRGSLVTLSGLVGSLLVILIGLGPLQHLVAQQQLRATFSDALAAGTAPVSEGDYQDVLLRDGDPVARIEIPSIGVDEVVVEGTTAGTLTAGPGHRRDTVLPGQSGVSVLMGRAAAYGGPFSRIHELPRGAQIRIITGQGEQRFEVIGVRYAGDPGVPRLAQGQARIVLMTAKGTPFMPEGIVRVDATLASVPQTPGVRQTTAAALRPAERELAIDTSTVWALVFAVQLLILVEVVGVWSVRRFGLLRSWPVGLPVVLLSLLLVADAVVRLLPNLM